MKTIVLQALSGVGLLMTILPAILVFTGHLENGLFALTALGTLLWFVTAPLWLKEQ
ncbi:MAG: hypothetical protein OEX02_11310 [Cyclobacteriaceae bacterium]|nr:hypothetical protein [Cyclobacteriaceae bacterium]